jgi:uncharacterized membrane protein YdbT with pleckstrin-like domain
MSVKDEMLAGETIAYTTEKHWFAPLRDSLVPILLLIGAYVVSLISPNPDGILSFVGTLFDWLRLGLLIVGIAWIVYNIIVWRTAVFAVTNRRVIREEGLVSRRSSATILSTVTDVQSRVPALGGPLGFGDLVIYTQSGEAGADRFKTIKNPKEFRDQMLNTKIGMETPAAAAAPAPAQAPVAPAPVAAAPVAAAPAAPTSDDQLQTLTRLAELRDSGAITPEEYEAKKTEVLSRI